MVAANFADHQVWHGHKDSKSLALSPIPALSPVSATNIGLSISDIHTRYRIGRKIGSGRFGTVHEAVDRLTGARVAIKTIPKAHNAIAFLCKRNAEEADAHQRMLQTEADISLALGGNDGHAGNEDEEGEEGVERGSGGDKRAYTAAEAGKSHIVRVLGVVEGRRHVYIVMEMCEGGSLASYFRRRRRGEVTSLAPVTPPANAINAAPAADPAAAAGSGADVSGASSSRTASFPRDDHDDRQQTHGEVADDRSSDSSAARLIARIDFAGVLSSGSSSSGHDAEKERRQGDAYAQDSDSGSALIGSENSPSEKAAIGAISPLELLERGAFGAARRRQQEREDEAAWIVYELAAAVAYMHRQGIIHRDIKPENVLIARPSIAVASAAAAPVAPMRKRCLSFANLSSALLQRSGAFSRQIRPVASHSSLCTLEASTASPASGTTRTSSNHSIGGLNDPGPLPPLPSLRLADFGLSERLSSAGFARRGLVGSPAYVAPEVAAGLPVGFAADVWGVGVCLYVALSNGHLPFTATDTRLLLRAVRRAALPMGGAAWVAVSAQAKAVVRRLLAGNPSDRPTAEEVMSMEWVVEGRRRWMERHGGKKIWNVGEQSA